MRTVIWFIFFWASLIALYPAQWLCFWFDRVGNFQKRDLLTKRAVRVWTKSLLKLAGVHVTVSGYENIPQGNCIFVSNHQGNFDIPLLLTYLKEPIPLLAKIELKKVPIIRNWMSLLQCVFVNRSNMRDSLNSIHKAIETVGNGYSMAIFPEGTRSKAHKMGEFKSGAFRIAEKAGLPIVPVIIDGTYKIMEGNNNWITPGEVTLKILPPIITEGMSRSEIKELEITVFKKIEEALG